VSAIIDHLGRRSQMDACRLTKKQRIARETEFDRIVKEGVRYTTRHFTIIIYRNSLESRRLGISVSKKVGGAVQRNRVKRLVREFFRTHKQTLPRWSDLLFIARLGSSRLKYGSLCEELLEFFDHLSLPQSESA
jgi:ribonuclease P protein component